MPKQDKFGRGLAVDWWYFKLQVQESREIQETQREAGTSETADGGGGGGGGRW